MTGSMSVAPVLALKATRELKAHEKMHGATGARKPLKKGRVLVARVVSECSKCNGKESVLDSFDSYYRRALAAGSRLFG
jgi:hypothetical protein